MQNRASNGQPPPASDPPPPSASARDECPPPSVVPVQRSVGCCLSSFVFRLLSFVFCRCRYRCLCLGPLLAVFFRLSSPVSSVPFSLVSVLFYFGNECYPCSCRAPLFRQSCVWLVRSSTQTLGVHPACCLQAVCGHLQVNLQGRSFRCFRSEEALVASDMVGGPLGRKDDESARVVCRG